MAASLGFTGVGLGITGVCFLESENHPKTAKNSFRNQRNPTKPFKTKEICTKSGIYLKLKSRTVLQVPFPRLEESKPAVFRALPLTSGLLVEP